MGPDGQGRSGRRRSRAATPIRSISEKLTVGRYYLARVLPQSTAHLAKLKTGAETMMALSAEGSSEAMATYRATADWSPGRGRGFP